MIRPDLREEIDLKVAKLRDNPKVYDTRQKLVKDSLRTLGNVYSFWIENPELRKQYLLHNKTPKTLKDMSKNGIRSLQNAWYYLLGIGQDGNFSENLTVEHIVGTNGLVNGKRACDGELRLPTENSTNDVTLNFPNYTPPSSGKIPQIMDEIVCKVNEGRASALETAIYSHLAIALTQPFMGGNKRTARLIQDRILFDAHLPPAVIPAGEAKFYFQLLGKVAPAYRDGNLEDQKLFYNYVASKVNNGLDVMLNDLGVPFNHIPSKL